MKEKITLEQLAEMVQRGFENTATKAEIASLRSRVDEIDVRLEDSFRTLNHRVDYAIELIEGDTRSRIEKLEETVERLKTKVGIN